MSKFYQPEIIRRPRDTQHMTKRIRSSGLRSGQCF